MNLKSKIKKCISYFKFQFTRLKNIPHQNDNKIVFLEMKDIAPNRRIIQILRYLTENNYFCLIYIRLKQFLHMDNIGLNIYKEKNIKCAFYNSYRRANIIISDHIDKFKGIKFKHLLQIVYNVFERQDDSTIFFPITFHPGYLFFSLEQKIMRSNLYPRGGVYD